MSGAGNAILYCRMQAWGKIVAKSDSILAGVQTIGLRRSLQYVLKGQAPRPRPEKQ
jgi:hypothetical protein